MYIKKYNPLITSISQLMMYESLAENKQKNEDLGLGDLGFVTTVLRDDELDDELHDYYQDVLTMICKITGDFLTDKEAETDLHELVDLHKLGLKTTVLRDNLTDSELDGLLRDYYQDVLKLIDEHKD